ncbi:MAG TPA: hypothetical protein VMG12_02030 [Polyangiaceae bacterium]|nr:hypothetical protein [Polyangiaceae bacterium]
MAKRKPPERARTARRAAERAADKLAQQRERLFQLEAGGTPERPIDVESSSVVEPRAAALECPRCQLAFRVEAHRAPSSPGMRLREAEVSCPRCGKRRSIWFRLVGESLN